VTEEQTAEMLSMLKVDLGIMGTTAYDERFVKYLQTADREIIKEGATPDYTDVADKSLCVMYAAYLWRRRDNMGAMPRMLRYELNNRILSEKARGADGE